MRIRIAAPALVGALALAAVAVPTAAFASTAKPVITKAVSPSLTLGLRGAVTLGVTVSARDASGVRAIYAEPYPLVLAAEGGAPTAADLKAEKDNLLKVRSSTATTQTASVLESVKVTQNSELPPNLLSGTWGVAVLVVAKDGASTFSVKATTFSWKRADTLTAKVSATKVRKGAALTVKGQLNRVNWDKHVYQGYGSRAVALEFRKAGGTAWTAVRTVTSGKTGALSATVTDSRAGSWRFVFGGNSTSGAAASAAITVGLK